MASIETQTQRLLAFVAVAGVLGWAGTYAVDAASPLSIEGDIYLVVAGWTLLVAAGAAAAWTTPAIRRAKAWRVWLYVSAAALGVNAVANTPQLIPDPELFALVQDYAYYHPWFAAYAVGYVATARYEPQSRLVGRTERRVYAASGVVSFAFLLAMFAASIPDEYVLLVGGVLHAVPPLAAVVVRRRDGVGT